MPRGDAAIPSEGEHRSAGRAAAVEVRAIGRHGERGGVVVEVVRHEGVAPFTVDRHRHATGAEVLLRVPLVARTGDELRQLVGARLEVAVAVHIGDEVVLPLQSRRPRRVRGEGSLSAVVQPLRAEHVGQVRDVNAQQ